MGTRVYVHICVHTCQLTSVVSNSVQPYRLQPARLLCPREKYWNGLPCPPQRDLPGPGIKPMCLMSPALTGGFPLVPTGKPMYVYIIDL